MYKNQASSDRRLFSPGDSSLWVAEESLDRQLSLGFSFRKVKANGVYEQFDLLELNWLKTRDATLVERQSSGARAEPSRGQEVEVFSALTGYQIGKLFPIVSCLSADVGVRGTAWYQRSTDTPLTSQGFPGRTKSAGLGLNLELGVIFQVHERINIGYHFIPATVKGFWQEEKSENPILTLEQQRERSVEFTGELLESVLNFRNIHINYIF
jgi:hypothetical protein